MNACDRPQTEEIGVIGGGSFGTVLADIAARNGFQVKHWMRDPKSVKNINEESENKRYLPGFKLHKNIFASTDIDTMADCSLVLISVPSTAFRTITQYMAPVLGNKIIVTTTKGIEPKTFTLMSDILSQEVKNAKIGVLSGPNFAQEIITQAISGTVIASKSELVFTAVRQALHCSYFRVYINHDVRGVELGGALKNIYAIMAGMTVALKLAENTKSLLITRALAEMSRFSQKMGADPLTFIGLSGVGDLVVTCASHLSRNFRVGYEIAKGKSLDEITKELGQVAEGVNTLLQVKERARKESIYMPIVEALNSIVFEGAPILRTTRRIMEKESNEDIEFSRSLDSNT